MNILIDTHIALWAITDTKSLTERMKTILEDEGNTIYYSIASVWEIAIKHKLHPDQFSISEEEFDSLCRKTEFHQLGIKNEHIYTIKTLVYPENAPKHNDPFDRLLLSQAKAEQLLFLTHDKKLSYYIEKCVLLL